MQLNVCTPSQVDEAVPFIVGEYDVDALPETLTFDGHHMKKAFKPETHYSIVVAAFAKTQVSVYVMHLKKTDVKLELFMCAWVYIIHNKGGILCFSSSISGQKVLRRIVLLQ